MFISHPNKGESGPRGRCQGVKGVGECKTTPRQGRPVAKKKSCQYLAMDRFQQRIVQRWREERDKWKSMRGRLGFSLFVYAVSVAAAPDADDPDPDPEEEEDEPAAATPEDADAPF